MVALADVAHAGAHGLDHARRLVAEDHRDERRPLVLHDREVAVAQAAVGDAHVDVPGRRRRHVDVVDHVERLAADLEQRGPHRPASSLGTR